MANALVGFQNWVDVRGIQLTTTSQASGLPVDNLADGRVAKAWRSATTSSASIILDAKQPRSLQLIGLFGCNATAAATFRIRVSDADPTGAAGEIYDSGSLAGSPVDPIYRSFIHVLPAPVMGQHIRVDIADDSLTHIEVGRWFAGPYWRPAIGVQFGLRRGYADPSVLDATLGGQVFIDRKPKARRFTFTFDFVSEAEMHAGLSEIDRLSSGTEDVLLLLDPESTNPGRDSIWGLLSNPSGIASTLHDNFQQSYIITERL